MGKTLVLTEKPSQASDFARILKCEKKQGYFEGDKFIVTFAMGHLLEAYEPEDYDPKYSKWNLEDLPIIPQTYKNKIKENTKGQFYIIKGLINRPDVTEILNAGDCGIEGEGIQYEIYYASGTKKPFKRIWYSDLTDKSIREALNNIKDAKEYINYYYAFFLRSKLDYLYGLNLTRAITVKFSKGGLVLSVGRCQTPLLNLIVKRDVEVGKFVPQTFYKVIADFKEYKGDYIDLNTKETRLFDKKVAESVANRVKGKRGLITRLEKEIKKVYAPSLFTLTDLKVTLSNKYGFSEDKTEKIMQTLYQDKKILSYPRTSSNHISDAIADEFIERLKILNFGDYQSIIKNINNDSISNTRTNKKYVDNSKITDHHAIIPTLQHNMSDIYESLSKDEKTLFNEVAMRFLAIFYNPYEYEAVELITKIGIDHFITTGKREINKGWKAIYNDGEEEDKQETSAAINNTLKENKEVLNRGVELNEGKTTKPKHYNTATLLQTMKRLNIGTEATRKKITETLYKRNYIKDEGRYIVSTQVGRDLINAISIEEIKSVDMTAELEEKLNNILVNKANYKELYMDALTTLNSHINKIKALNNIVIKKEIELLGKCPECGKGSIVHRKGFYGCSNYKEGCKFSISETIKGGKIKEDDIKRLLEKGSTNQIKGTGGVKFKLKINNNKVLFDCVK